MEPRGDELGWIEAAQRGDHEAFARLVEAYKLPVYNIAYRMLGNAAEAEDVAQEVFLRAYLKLATYDRERKFSTWLLSIASNYCIDVLRRRRAQLVTLDDAEFAIPSREPGPEERAVEGEQREAVARAIAALAPAYRLPAVLRYYYDLPYEEIEQITGLSEATVKTRLHRARRMIKDFLEKQGALPWSAEMSGR
jgi:RNA polymerase sigma-70 factor (ECF subfamily)